MASTASVTDISAERARRIAADEEDDTTAARRDRENADEICTKVKQGYLEARDHRNPRLEKFLDYYRAFRCYKPQPEEWTDLDKWKANDFIGLSLGIFLTVIPNIGDQWFNLRRPPVRMMRRGLEDVEKATSLQELVTYQCQVSGMATTAQSWCFDIAAYGKGFIGCPYVIERGPRYYRRQRTIDISSIMGRPMEPIPIPDSYETVKEKDAILYDDPRPFYIDTYSVFPTPRADSIKNAPKVNRRYLMSRDKVVARMEAGLYRKYTSEELGTMPKEDDWYMKRLESVALGPANNSERYGHAKDSDAERGRETWVEIIEEWSKGRLRLIANRRVLLQDTENIYGFIPIIEAPFIHVPGEFDGIGIFELLAAQDNALNDLYNARRDMIKQKTYANRVVNPRVFVNKGQLFRRASGRDLLVKGGVDPSKVLHYDTGPEIDSALYQEGDVMKSVMEYKSGITEYLRGGTERSMADTAMGIQILADKATSRINYHARQILVFGVVELFRQMLELDRLFMPPGKMYQVTNKDIYRTMNPEDLSGMIDIVPVLDPTGAEERAEARMWQEGADKILAMGAPFGLQPNLEALIPEASERYALGREDLFTIAPPAPPQLPGNIPPAGPGMNPQEGAADAGAVIA